MNSVFRTSWESRRAARLHTLLRLFGGGLLCLLASSALPTADLTSDPQQLLDDYATEINRLQSEFGAYHAPLGEALFGLGDAQQRLGRHQEAIETFTQSVHIKRINDGLYAPSILPVLEKLVASYAQLGDWESVDDQHNFMMEVNGQNFGWSDERMLPVLDKLTRWHMYAFFEDVTPEPARHLQMARSLFTAASRVIEINFGQHDLRMAKQLRGRRVADYYLAHIMQEEAEDMARMQRLHSVGLADDGFRYNHGARAVSQGYLSGLRSSRQVVDIYRNNDSVGPEQTAQAIVELGDWYLRFNKRQSAISTYMEAYQLLSADEALLEKRSELFDKPQVLDFTSDYSEYLAPPDDGLATGYVLLQLNLSRVGTVSKVEFVEASEGGPSMRRRAVNEVRSRRFRPRFVDGKPVASEAVKYRYVYRYAGNPSALPAASQQEQADHKQPDDEQEGANE